MLQFDSCSANIGSWDQHKIKKISTPAPIFSPLELMQKSASAGPPRGGDARQAQPAQSRGSRPVDHVADAEEVMLLGIRHDLYIKVIRILGPLSASYDIYLPGDLRVTASTLNTQLMPRLQVYKTN
ncbi:hypothetical protein GQ55_5G404000 [Panicum hallii var. hallii]|uniref:Uncharacterized protein n=1 Tax=Panicum hallii var. hallii TaxID=1504633 RepID=A0A2T7DNG9_9POAL|nr:hypothetical protein GQ55_5G404000 [Panicum hallii var. hallii]